MPFQNNAISQAFGNYAASNNPPAAAQFAQGIGNLGVAITGGNPEDVAKARLYGAQMQMAQGEATQTGLKNNAIRNLAGAFNNSLVRNSDGTVSFDPAKFSSIATALGTLEPRFDPTPYLKSANQMPDSYRQQAFDLQKQNNEVKTLAPGESMVRASMVGGPAITPQMTPSQGLATFQQPDMPMGSGALPQQQSQVQGGLAQAFAPSQPQQAEDPAAFQSAVAGGIPIYDRLTDAQKAAPYAAGFSHAADTGFVPKAQIVSLPQVFAQNQPAQPQGDGIAPAAFTRDANGALTSASQIKPAHLPEAGVRDIGDDLEMIRQIDSASSALHANPSAIGFVKGHVPNSILQMADPSGIPARASLASVMNAGFHELYMSRLTPVEINQGGLQLPTMTDTPQAAMTKLSLARQRIQHDLADKQAMYSPKSGYVMDPVMSQRIQQNALPPTSSVIPPPPGVGVSQPQQQAAKALDPATAQQFLSQAGGDKDKARQLAAQSGYSF